MVIELDPSVIFVDKDWACGPGHGIGEQKLVFVLQPVHVLEQEMVRVGPFHTRNVKVVRIAGGFHPDGFAGVEGNYTDANGRIASARFRIWIDKRLGIDADLGMRNLGDDFSSRAVQVVDESEVLYAFRVELPKGDGAAVGAPLEAVSNVELFFVNPVGGAIDDGGGAIVR